MFMREKLQTHPASIRCALLLVPDLARAPRGLRKYPRFQCRCNPADPHQPIVHSDGSDYCHRLRLHHAGDDHCLGGAGRFRNG